MQKIPAVFFIIFVLCLSVSSVAAEKILQKNLLKTQPGDFIVVNQNKALTLLMVYAKEGPVLTFEEISAPAKLLPVSFTNWKDWVEQRAPGNTCWIRYRINVMTGHLLDAFSFTQNSPFVLSQGDLILSKLMQLDFTLIPLSERKKAGPAPSIGLADRRPIWQPQLMMNGRQIEGVTFNGWRARWLRDGSELSGKMIEIYLPVEEAGIPAYFPYWLEIQGKLGSAKVRIIDSGKGLRSPYPVKIGF